MRSDKLSQGIDPADTLTPAARTADATGTAVDLANHTQAAVLIHHGAWTDGTHTFEVQEADDDGSGSPDTWAAVADADLDGTEPAVSDATADDTVTVIGYRGVKRHLRVNVTVASATTGAVYGAQVVRGGARKQPA